MGSPLGNFTFYLFFLFWVAVHGVEYAFGAHEYPTTGIFEAEPKQCDVFTFRKSILIGKTELGPVDVRGVMEDLAEEYKGNAYNLITKNCNHFCNDACTRLTGNPIPSWINRLAIIGFFCNCVLPVTLNATKVRHHRIEDKSCEGEKKKLTNDDGEAQGNGKWFQFLMCIYIYYITGIISQCSIWRGGKLSLFLARGRVSLPN